MIFQCRLLLRSITTFVAIETFVVVTAIGGCSRNNSAHLPANDLMELTHYALVQIASKVFTLNCALDPTPAILLQDPMVAMTSSCTCGSEGRLSLIVGYSLSHSTNLAWSKAFVSSVTSTSALFMLGHTAGYLPLKMCPIY